MSSRNTYLMCNAAIIACAMLSVTGCTSGDGFFCPTGGYDDGYAVGRRYAEYQMDFDSAQFLESPEPLGIGSLMLELEAEFRRLYRAPEGLDCPGYDLEFSAGMLDGMLDTLARLEQELAQGE